MKVNLIQKICFHIFDYIPDITYGFILIGFAFVIGISPYWGGHVILGKKVPVFSSKENRILKIVGPFLLLISIAINVPHFYIIL